ncbi:hypothetical protein AgCh_029037 [Apium graveolens]
MNINDGGVDRCIQVTLINLQTLRASELDVMIDRVNQVIQEDTQLLQELKKAQREAFPEAYLYPKQGVVYICTMTKQVRHLLVPKHCVRLNMRLIMTLQYDLKHKKNKKHEDVEMINILERYVVNPDTMLPNTQYNLRKDKDDDEHKKDDQNPPGSNLSQFTKPSGSKGGEKKKEGDKKNDEKKRASERRSGVGIKALGKPAQFSNKMKKSEVDPGSQCARAVIARGRAQSLETQRARAGQARGRTRSNSKNPDSNGLLIQKTSNLHEAAIYT